MGSSKAKKQPTAKKGSNGRSGQKKAARQSVQPYLSSRTKPSPVDIVRAREALKFYEGKGGNVDSTLRARVRMCMGDDGGERISIGLADMAIAKAMASSSGTQDQLSA